MKSLNRLDRLNRLLAKRRRCARRTCPWSAFPNITDIVLWLLPKDAASGFVTLPFSIRFLYNVRFKTQVIIAHFRPLLLRPEGSALGVWFGNLHQQNHGHY